MALARDGARNTVVRLAGRRHVRCDLTGNILLAPRLGAGALVALVVAGQLIFSVLLDNFGWFGFALHPAGVARMAGCILMIIGVFLIARF